MSAKIVDEKGQVVPDAGIALQAEVTETVPENPRDIGCLAGYGSANPITTENYTAGHCTA